MTISKIKISIYLFAIVFICFLAAPSFFTSSFLSNLNKNENDMNLYPSVFDLTEEDKIWIEDQLNKLTLGEKIAQMVTIQVPANSTLNSSDFKKVMNYVEELKVGGIIFSTNNVKTQILLTNKLQEISNIPLLVTADFENGLGMRLNETVEFPFNMALAATGDDDLAFKMGKIISEEAGAIGVHQNFAPVADINNNYLNPIINVRSFSDNKEIVSSFVSNFIFGSKKTRTISTVKHFPGHGNTNIDSHYDLPKLNVDRLNLANNELVPFVHAIEEGVQSVMIGHIEVPSIDPGSKIPATLSYRAVTDLLQNELGFDGLIVTDAMDMNAITKYFSDDEAAVLAVMAGNDIILMPRNPQLVVNSIVKAVDDGKISEERIDISVRKILSAKRWLQLDKNKIVDLQKAERILAEKKDYLLASKIAEKSITLVKDENKLIPVDPSKIYRTSTIYVTNGSSGKFFFEELLDENFGYINKIIINSRSRDKDYKKALEIAENSDLIILSSFVKVRSEYAARNAENNFDLITGILGLNKPVILISFGDPYLLSYFPQAKTYLCSYGNTEVSQRAMMNALLGKISVQGTLPVSIPGTEFKLKSGEFVQQDELNFNPFEKEYYALESVDIAMLEGIDNKIFPGGVLLVGKGGKVIYQKPFGRFSYDNSSTLMSEETIFDLASLSRTVATKTAAMFLYDEEKLNPDFKVSYYLKDFGNNGKENITVQDLLLNKSLLPDIKAEINQNRDSFVNSILNSKADSIASESYLNSIVLQLMIEKITEKSIDEYLKVKLFNPLGLKKILYNPPKELWYYIPQTSDVIDKRKRNKGVAYDTAAFVMNGIAGHSGLFSSARELAVFAQLIMQNGNYFHKQWIKPSTIQKFLTVPANSPAENNTLLFTGETGTSIYINLKEETFIILLTNSIYSRGNVNSFSEFRSRLHENILTKLEF